MKAFLRKPQIQTSSYFDPVDYEPLTLSLMSLGSSALITRLDIQLQVLLQLFVESVSLFNFKIIFAPC